MSSLTNQLMIDSLNKQSYEYFNYSTVHNPMILIFVMQL